MGGEGELRSCLCARDISAAGDGYTSLSAAALRRVGRISYPTSDTFVLCNGHFTHPGSPSGIVCGNLTRSYLAGIFFNENNSRVCWVAFIVCFNALIVVLLMSCLTRSRARGSRNSILHVKVSTYEILRPIGNSSSLRGSHFDTHSSSFMSVNCVF